jgi:hypothetical protein
MLDSSLHRRTVSKKLLKLAPPHFSYDRDRGGKNTKV